MSSGTENRETGQERHPVDLASKTSTMKSSVDPTRSAPMQAASQLRNIGTTAVRVQSSSIQTVVTSSTASQVSHIGSGTQMSLKQVPVGIQRSNLPVCTATSAATLVQSGTAVSTRPSVVPATSPLPMQMNAAVAATTYHVPRGAAAVANIAAPRSAVATPIVRATTNLQSTAATQHTGSFSPGLRGLSPSGLLPRAPSPASQGSAWLSGTSIPTTVPKCASPGPLRTPSITTIQQYTQGRSSSMTVTARPLTPQGRMQSESPRPQLVHASPTQKPIAATQTATQVITQPAHGPSIQITQMPVSSVAGKLPQSLHGVTSLQTAIAITTGATRTVAYTATTTVAASNVSGIRPVTVATPAIPVAKVFPQAAGVGREQIGANSVSEVTLPVHAIQAPQPVQQQQPQPTMVATQQGATSVYIQTSHRTSPAPTSTQAAADRTSTTLPTYTLPATYYYETSSGYQVGSSLVARPYTPASPYTVQTTTAPALRPGVTTHQVHGIMTGAQPVRFNPVMVVDPTRTSMPVHSSFVTEGTLVQAEGSALGQTTQAQPPSKQNASPRPSILRKRDNEGSPLKAQKNLAPVLAALSSGAPVSPPSPRRPDSRGNGGNSSGGSTTISATSSPGLGEGGDDSLPPIKQEPVEESERPPVEMSPRKKPRKQQLTGNELHEPKFSEDEMEFISEEKIKKEAKEDVAYNSHEHPVTEDCEEKIYIPKRPNISLINSYRHTWKSRHNHYLRYSDVKPKDERRPTVTDLANQKQVLQKLNGWKIYHLSTQMEDLSDLEMQVFEKLTAMLKVMEKKTGKELDKDVNRVNELIKGNMQRSKVIKDQMQEAKSQVMKIFDHKSHVADIISRCANKRSFKKREKS